MIASALTSKRAFRSLDFESEDEVFKALVKPKPYWSKMNTIEPMLRACCMSILQVESDGSRIEDAFSALISIGNAIESTTHPKKGAILALYRKRASALYSPAIMIGGRSERPVCPAAQRISADGKKMLERKDSKKKCRNHK